MAHYDRKYYSNMGLFQFYCESRQNQASPPKGVVVVTSIYDMNDTSGCALNNNWQVGDFVTWSKMVYMYVYMSVLLAIYVLIGRGMGPVVFMNPDQESFCTKDHCNQMAISIYKFCLIVKGHFGYWSDRPQLIMGAGRVHNGTLPHWCLYLSIPFHVNRIQFQPAHVLSQVTYTLTSKYISLKQMNAFGVSCQPQFVWNQSLSKCLRLHLTYIKVIHFELAL